MKIIGIGSAICLAFMATTLAAAAPKPAPGAVPLASLTEDQAIDCMFRMIRLSNTSSKAAKDPAKSETDRKTAEVVDDQAARGVSFYTGFLYTRPWIANRSAQAAKLFAGQGSEDANAASEITRTCLSRAMDAQGNLLAAALGQ